MGMNIEMISIFDSDVDNWLKRQSFSIMTV